MKVSIGNQEYNFIPRPRSWFNKKSYEHPFALTGRYGRTVNYLDTGNPAERIGAAIQALVAIFLRGSSLTETERLIVVDMVGVRLGAMLIDNPGLDIRDF